MKVAIVSDTHFGYGWDGEREDDAFRNAREAFERTRDADVVILPGDIFDRKVPKQEVLDRAADCFNVYRQGTSTVSIAEDSDVQYEFEGTAVVAIHGTHERRTRGFVNPIELLDTMGYLLHLHNEVVVFEKDGEKVAVHGMSGVPERYAPAVLKKFAPEPVPDAYNIFVFHQSVKNFVFTDADHEVLTLEQLPDGFDLLVDGHIHWANLDNVGADKPLIFPGSTITTQMNKVEAEQPKGFVTVDTASGAVDFHELNRIRELFHEEVDVAGLSATEILDAVGERMAELVSGQELKPLVRLILQGETDAHVKPAEIRRQYRDQAILSLSTRFSTGGSEPGTGPIRKSEKSIAEMGRELLLEKIDDSHDVSRLFDLLVEERVDEALDLVEEMTVEEQDDDAEAADADAETESGEEDGGGTTLADYAE